MIADEMRWVMAVTVGMTMGRSLQHRAVEVQLMFLVQVRFSGQMQRNEVHPPEEIQRDQQMQPPTRRTRLATNSA
jgi:hypothetical protein